MSEVSEATMPYRRIVTVAALIVLIQLVTLPVLITMDEPGRGAETDEAGDTRPEPEPEPAIADQRFSGSGHGRTDPFPIEGGLAVFHIEHRGGGNFIVRLEDTDENRVDGLVNVIGSFDGSTAAHLDPGDYVLAFRALEDWSVTVEQPRHDRGDALPVSYADDQPQAVGPFRVDDDATVEFALTHAGRTNFVVRLLDRDGRRVAGVLNAQGEVDTTEEHDLEAGLYLIDVRSDGAWTIAIE